MTVDHRVHPAARNRVLGDRFVSRWQTATLFQRIGLLLGVGIKPLVEGFIPDDTPVPQETGQDIVRDRIGAAMADHSRRQPGVYSARLSAIAVHYLWQTHLRLVRQNWDVGIAGDPLVKVSSSYWRLQSRCRRRRRDFATLQRAVAALTPIRLSPVETLTEPFLYLSGMPFSPIPSGYGVRTTEILAGLRAVGVDPILRHFTFSHEAAHPQTELSYALGAQASVADMINRAVLGVKSDAITTGAQTLAGGSNWLAGVTTLFAAREMGLAFIYDVRGLWPLTRAAVEPAYAHSSAFKAQMAMEWGVMRAADRVMVISEQLRDLAIAEGVAPERLNVVPNFLSFSDIPPPRRSKEAEKDTYIMGHAGSLTSYEGLDTALVAMQRTGSVAGKALHLWIAGDGPHRMALQDRAMSLGMGHRVDFLGKLPRDEVLRRTQGSDVMIYPRQNSPVFQVVPPLKTIEAMALGVPIIVSDLAPLRDLAGPNECRAVVAVAPVAPNWGDLNCVQSWQDAFERALTGPSLERGDAAVHWVRRERAAPRAIQPWATMFGKGVA